MRIVQNQNDFVDAFLGAQREADASFGISTILLEKYIMQPRHIEVQVLLWIVPLLFLVSFVCTLLLDLLVCKK